MTLGECLIAIDKAAWQVQQLARSDPPAEQQWNDANWFRAAMILLTAAAPDVDRKTVRHYLKGHSGAVADNEYASIATSVLDEYGFGNWQTAIGKFVYAIQAYAKLGPHTDFLADMSGVIACHCMLTANEFFEAIDVWRNGHPAVELVSLEEGPAWIVSLDRELERMKLP